MKLNTRRCSKNAERGVTLVALVVTVIILLIIAGTAVSISIDGGGLLSKSALAKEKWNEAVINEEDVINSYLNYIKPISIKFTSNEDEIQTGTEEKSLADYYGQTVSPDFFSSVEGIDWQLYYDDDEYIFLISSDYISTDLLPDELIKETASGNYKTYRAKFGYYENNEIKGSIMTEEPWCNGAASTTIKSNPLTAKYLKWALYPSYSNSTNINMRAVAFMMDTSKWSDFAGNKYSNAFAIGAPTLELFVKSFNSVSSNKFTEYDEINESNTNSNGYLSKRDSTSYWYREKIGGVEPYTTTIWNIYNGSKAYGQYLASPLASSTSRLHLLGSYAYEGETEACTLGCGFRPIVVIPKTMY